MSDQGCEQRRDPRYNLRDGYAFADFDDPRDPESRWCGQLCSVSAAGIALQVEASLGLTADTVLPEVLLRIGECKLTGSIVVKNVVRIDAHQSAIGGLFYPRTDDEAGKLMALMSGMEAVESISHLPAYDGEPEEEYREVPVEQDVSA